MNLICAEQAYLQCSEGAGDMAFSLYCTSAHYNGGILPVLFAFSQTVNCRAPTVGRLPVTATR